MNVLRKFATGLLLNIQQNEYKTLSNSILQRMPHILHREVIFDKY